ncbi:MAG TPA: flavodoxin domain-containing protein [Jiangellales bacterium]|nr:flavodoxin domain-containing protein [Jiangellales bacterium]
MKVLVGVASKHGSTQEIGERLASTLAAALDAQGLPTEVDLRDAGAVDAVIPYDAVVVASAIYAGRWLGPASDLVEGQADELRKRPVWLVSSGPVGDPPKPEGEPPDGTRLAELVGAQHRVLAGRLDRDSLSRGERLVARMVKAPDGDFRDWAEVDQVAGEIADALISR